MEPEVRLMLGDCLERMADIPAGSVGHIVTDPPYGQTNESYDRGVAPGLWKECFRVSKPDAVLVSFAGGPTYHRIASDIEAAGWKVRQMWGWIYKDGMITSAWPKEGFDRLAPAMDPIVFATKGKVILDLEREGDGWACWSGRSGEPISKRAKLGKNTSAPGHWPRSVVCSDGLDGFQFFMLSRGADRGFRTGHPNQKPLSLMRWIVDKLPGKDPILDPYSGSGTTLIAAIDAGRPAIGIELSPEYLSIAERRIADARSSTPLFAEGA